MFRERCWVWLVCGVVYDSVVGFCFVTVGDAMLIFTVFLLVAE